VWVDFLSGGGRVVEVVEKRRRGARRCSEVTDSRQRFGCFELVQEKGKFGFEDAYWGKGKKREGEFLSQEFDGFGAVDAVEEVRR